MNLHEFQAKNLMKSFGVSVPESGVATTIAQALEVAQQLGGEKWVVKAQVHAGGRGKAGGVKLVDNKQALEDAVKGMLGTRLVTYQTTAEGQPVDQVLIEAPCDIKHEYYLGAVIDRARQCVAIMASTEGGVDIETVAEKTPEKIHTLYIDPLVGLQPFQCRDLFFKLNIDVSLMRDFCALAQNLYRLFVEKDLALLEINPLVVTKDGQLLCLDSKINIDENALYRQESVRQLRDPKQEDERENHAQRWGLNYISLDGEIGCMVNGAGLAMATMDLIKLKGGSPANFLDVGGGATRERVTEAFKIIVSDKHVKGIFVNIFGGIVRCDLIAEGIIAAVADVGVNVPVVVRLQGNQAEKGLELLAHSGLNIVPADIFENAAEKIVDLVKGEA